MNLDVQITLLFFFKMTHLHDALASSKYPGPYLPTPNHIRLVSLLPGSTSTITCELITVDIHSAPEYEALSYTWGNALDRQAINIQSTSLQQPTELLATSNCVSALHRLRYRDRPRLLWVDSLAINQSDISEKNHQFTLVSKVYSQATKVIIYLGEPADNSDLAIEFITECDYPSSDTTSLSYPKSELLTDALYSFFRRPWFTRVWVILEAFLSNAALAYCGEKTIPWSAIENFNSWNIASKWLRQLPFAMYASEKSLIRGNVESSMFTALSQTRHCSAANQRDKIYALLPLFQSFIEQLNITPNYGDTVTKVYTDCAIALLPECGFKLLSAVQGRSNIDYLPSWVPDWSMARKCSHVGAYDLFYFGWKVSGEQLPQLTTHVSTNNSMTTVSLRSTGHLCGRISGIGSAYVVGRNPLPLLEWQRLAFGDSVVDQRIEREPLSEPLERIFYAVLAAINEEHVVDHVYNFFTYHQHDWWYEGYETSLANEVRRMASLRRDKKAFEEDTLPFEDIPFHLAASALGHSMQVCVQAVLRACHSRRFFITDTGYMGIASDNAQIMDHIYICAGSGVPFVFREVDDKPHGHGMKQFRLIGQSHIEQEAWDDLGALPNALGDLEII